MRVTELCQEDWGRWDTYVRQAPGALPQHLAGWQSVLHKTYRYPTRYLFAEREQGEIAGILPLFLLRNPLTGTTLTTLPGGMCVDDEEAENALLVAAKRIAGSLHAKRLVLHDSRRAIAGSGAAGFYSTCDHESWLLDLAPFHEKGGKDGGEEALMAPLDRNIRRQIRIAQRNELRAVVDRTGNALDDFYHILSRFTHESGTPIFARKFLAEVIAAFPTGFNIVMVYQGDQPLGGYFQLEVGKKNVGVWGATLHEFLELRPVYLAYWTIIADSVAQGFDTLDMGRSPAESNASKYKSQWGTRSQPIYQQTWVGDGATNGAANGTVNAQPMSVAKQAQADSRFLAFRRLWPKLPLPVAEFVGPLIRRQIPFG